MHAITHHTPFPCLSLSLSLLNIFNFKCTQSLTPFVITHSLAISLPLSFSLLSIFKIKCTQSYFLLPSLSFSLQYLSSHLPLSCHLVLFICFLTFISILQPTPSCSGNTQDQCVISNSTLPCSILQLILSSHVNPTAHPTLLFLILISYPPSLSPTAIPREILQSYSNPRVLSNPKFTGPERVQHTQLRASRAVSAPYTLPKETESSRETSPSERAASAEPGTVISPRFRRYNFAIPDLGRAPGAWLRAVKQWEEVDPITNYALRDWPKEWYEGNSPTASKRNQRKTNFEEYIRYVTPNLN